MFNDGIEKSNKCIRLVRDFSRCDPKKLNEELSAAPWQAMDSLDNIDAKWHYWKALFLDVFDASLKRACVRKKTLPWITWETRALMRACNYHCTKAKRTKKDIDWKKYKKLRNLVTMNIKNAKQQHFDMINGMAGRKPRKAWKELERLTRDGQQKRVEVIQTKAGTISDQQGIANEFSMFFSYIATLLSYLVLLIVMAAAVI